MPYFSHWKYFVTCPDCVGVEGENDTSVNTVDVQKDVKRHFQTKISPTLVFELVLFMLTNVQTTDF